MFDIATHQFLLDGAPVSAAVMQGVANAVINQAQFRISDLALQLQNGTINLATWYGQMQTELLNLHAAQVALAHGGFNNMNDAAWTRAADVVQDQLDYLWGFANDVQNGRYGAAVEADAFLARANQYAEAGRATYENEQALDKANTLGHTEAMRVQGAADSCEDCVNWAALGWIPVNDMLSDYPIAASVCRVYCHCVIVTR